jgi:hypothetical protein
MYGVILIYSFLLGILSYAVFRREVWLLILFYLFFEMGVYNGYNHLNMRWSFPKRIAFLSIYFLGYFSLFILYGNRLMYDDFTMDKI